MSALPVISHHLFVAAIDEPEPRPSGKLDTTDTQTIHVKILDWAEHVPNPVQASIRPASLDCYGAPHS
jgi:hypothetical protein